MWLVVVWVRGLEDVRHDLEKNDFGHGGKLCMGLIVICTLYNLNISNDRVFIVSWLHS